MEPSPVAIFRQLNFCRVGLPYPEETWLRHSPQEARYLTTRVVLLRWNIVNRTYGTHKKALYFPIFTNNIYLVLFTMAPRNTSTTVLHSVCVG